HWQFSTEATYYRNRIREWIQWTPTGTQGIWSPQNLLAVKTEGLEFSLQSVFSKKSTTITCNFQYALNSATYQQSESVEQIGRQLEYTPLHNFLTSLQAAHKDWLGNVTFSFTGTREIFGYNATMPAYALGNAMLGRNLKHNKVQYQLLFKCNNFLHTQYQTYGYYAMPGRSFSLSLRFQFNP
ncbi:MAG: TonB-dependent receptor, partial [Verrucomicrobia bacterium]|nr:TonB-dependent receptor [Cytophagales bacterium]